MGIVTPTRAPALLPDVDVLSAVFWVEPQAVSAEARASAQITVPIRPGLMD